MSIAEVQITCAILMGLITLFLRFLLPTNIVVDKKIHYSRKLLTNGTFLIALHFLLQYVIQKNLDNVSDIRTVLNLLFGIPITYFFNLSYLYLLLDGNIHKRVWWMAPISLICSFTLFFVCNGLNIGNHGLDYATWGMSTIYGIVLLYYAVYLLKAYLKVRKDLRKSCNTELILLLDWTKWSLFILVIISFGFPILTFCANSNIRSIYGCLSISSCFFYVLSFVGYCLTCCAKPLIAPEFELVGKKKGENVNTENAEEIAETINAFIASNFYTTPGITLKDAAIQMGISCNRLRVWLRSTEYEKFNNWIVYLRIEKSKELLLKYPELKNEEISQMCGFCDRQYFQRQFAKLEGVTPTKWVKERREKEI